MEGSFLRAFMATVVLLGPNIAKAYVPPTGTLTRADAKRICNQPCAQHKGLYGTIDRPVNLDCVTDCAGACKDAHGETYSMRCDQVAKLAG